jgi:hypothetical protein
MQCQWCAGVWQTPLKNCRVCNYISAVPVMCWGLTDPHMKNWQACSLHFSSVCWGLTDPTAKSTGMHISVTPVVCWGMRDPTEKTLRYVHFSNASSGLGVWQTRRLLCPSHKFSFSAKTVARSWELLVLKESHYLLFTMYQTNYKQWSHKTHQATSGLSRVHGVEWFAKTLLLLCKIHFHLVDLHRVLQTKISKPIHGSKIINRGVEKDITIGTA